MCKSKAENGGVVKRCFAHSKGTRHSLTYISAKTGIDKQQIYDIMKELRKEGRMLDAPTQKELEKYFDLEEFKTKYDTELSEQEKVAILKQLLSARLEAQEQGVQGGVFHAWKNALARTVERFKKPFIGLALAGTLLFTASCSAGVVNPDNTKGPEETKAPTAAECVIENPDELGDVVALEEITDEYGTYCHVTVSPEAKDGYLTLATAPNGAELEAAGFTDEDLIKAQDIAYKIAVEETLDGSRLDNNTQTIAEYYKENLRDKIDPSSYETYDSITKDYPDSNIGLLITDAFAGQLIRDGQPRVESVTMKTTSATVEKVKEGAKRDAGSEYLLVKVDYVGLYRASDESIIATLQKNDPNLTVENIQTANPDLFDEDPNSKYALASSQDFAFDKDGGIIGTSMTYSLFTYSASNTILTR